MDTSEYNSNTLDICELIGCYFVNAFYNSLYASAKAEAVKNSTSITQEYKLAILSYTNAINSDGKYYSQTVQGLLNWFRVNTQHITISLEDFENKVIREFVPKIFYIDMSKKEKDIILSEIITKAANELGAFIAKPSHIGLVIDKRKDLDNVRYFRAEMHSIMLARHDIIYGKFLERNKVKKVDAHFVDKLKEALKKQVKEKIELKNECDRAKLIAEKLQSDINQLEDDYKSQVKSLENQLNTKDDKIIAIKSAMEELVRDKERFENNYLQSISELEQLKLQNKHLHSQLDNNRQYNVDHERSLSLSSDESDEDYEAADAEFEKKFKASQLKLQQDNRSAKQNKQSPHDIVNQLVGDFINNDDNADNIIDTDTNTTHDSYNLENGFIMPSSDNNV